MQNYWIRWPTRVTTHYLTTYFELLSTHFKLCRTHSKFLETHFKFTTNSEIFTTHFKIFATHFEIFATHFEIFTTHSPQYPKCWQRKRNGYAAPPSSFDFFPRVESLCKFRSNFVLNAGRILQITKKWRCEMKPAGRRICLLKNLKKRKRNNGPRLFGNNVIIISCVARIHFCLLRLAVNSTYTERALRIHYL